MPDLSGSNVTLSLAVKCLEGLHEVGKGACVLLVTYSLVDGQDLLEFVLFLA